MGLRPRALFGLAATVACSAALAGCVDDLPAGEDAGVSTDPSALAAGAPVRLVRKGSGKCLDVSGAGTADGTKLQQWDCNGTAAQSFSLDDRGGGVYRLINSGSQKCAAAVGGGTADGTAIELRTCGTSGAQTFRVENAGGGYSRLVNPASGRCLDVSGASAANGAVVQLWTCNGTDAQSWQLQELGAPPPPPPPPASYIVNAHFTSAALGTYTRGEVAADFGAAPPWDNGLSQGRAKIEQEGGNKFLRVTYPDAVYGPASGGVQFLVDLRGDYDELYFAYRVRFQAGFAFNMGGKLPGLVGGSGPSGCNPDPGGFSARNMWRTGGAIVQYVYWPDQPNDCGDDRYYKSGGSNVPFVPGRWHTVEHRIKMNTPGQRNGVLQGWVDGTRYLDETNRQWRKSSAFAIDALYFSTFFGGGSQPWASPKQQTADFDDLRVSTQPITH